MYLYYIRHAEPIYNPDTITEKGEKQAKALATYLKEFKIDALYSSSSTRAIKTMNPARKLLNLPFEIFDWAREDVAWDYFAIKDGEKYDWCFVNPKILDDFNKKEVMNLGYNWYNSELFKDYKFKEGIEFVDEKVDEFFLNLGLKHDREKRCYYRIKDVKKGVAFFAHGGFGMVFLSSVLDIPYNIFCLHFSAMSVSTITTISFDGKDIVYPRLVNYSDSSHLFKEGIKPYNENIV